ncbi:MAG: O-antigen ligase family protein [Bacteroidota bacterium]
MYSPSNLSWFGCLVFLVGMIVSKAMLGIAMGILGAASLWYIIQHRDFGDWKNNLQAWAGLPLVLLALFSILYTEDMSGWVRDIKTKLLFIAVPFGLVVIPPFRQRQYALLFWGYLITLSVVSILTLNQYVGDFESMTVAVGQNTPIDIVGSYSHIYFGLMQAFGGILGLAMIIEKSYVGFKGEKWLLIAVILLQILCLHIFSSRTGMVAFYLSLGGLGFYYFIQQTNFWIGMAFVVMLVGVPVLSYLTVPSFKLRMDVSLWDWQQYQLGNDVSDLSFGKRLVAWETALDVYGAHPIAGVGISDVETSMQAMYETNGWAQKADAGKLLQNPHNQYLEYMVSLGSLGIIAFFCLLSFRFFWPGQPLSLLFVAFIVLFMSGMLFESFLERQLGLSFFGVFYMLIPAYQRSRLQADSSREQHSNSKTKLYEA